MKKLKQLEKEQEATQKRMSDNWKYIADIFLAAFPNARLNFDINPPVDSRAGQNSLDEISDYLIHRYGQRIYLTRQNVDSAKHGFDQYRILLKFRGDTITGLQLTPSIPSADLNKLCRHALDDGISFAELPLALITSTDSQVKAALAMLASHIGYQLLSKEARLPEKARAGEPLQAAFRFVNLGAAEPARPIRNLDKDVASSLRVQIELSDRKERTVVVSLHTPGIPSNAWGSGQLVSWEEELRMPELAAGVYSIHMSLVDEEANRRICFLDARLPGEPTPTIRCPLGTIEITPGAAAASSATPAAAPAR